MNAGLAESEQGMLAARLLDVIERDIVPLTRAGIARGDKIFGAAILRKADRALVVAGANRETENPLYHGEISALNAFYELPRASRPAEADCLFLATHEPCPLCLSAITWGGFDNFTYLFGYAETRDAFAIPHDLGVLKEVFGVENGAYRRTNAYWQATSIAELIAGAEPADRDALDARVDAISRIYDELSATYQAGKGRAGIPLA